MISSRDHNKPEKIFRTGINLQATFWTAMTGVVCLMILGAMSVHGMGVIVLIIGFMTSIYLMIQTFHISNYVLEGGDFPGHGKEMMFLKYFEKIKKFPESIRFDQLQFSKFNSFENIEKTFKNRPFGSDPNSVYCINKGYSEIFGFEIVSPEDLKNSKIDLRRVLVETLEKAPTEASLQLIKYATNDTSEILSEIRPALLEKQVKKVKYYLIVRLDSFFHDKDDKRDILDRLQLFRRLEKTEIEHLREKIATPRDEPSGHFQRTAVQNLDSIKPYFDDFGIGAFSLGALPGRVDDFFSDQFASLQTIDHCLSVRYIKHPKGKLSDILEGFKQEKKRKRGDESVSDKRKVEHTSILEADDDLCSIEMDLNCLLYGTGTEIERAIAALRKTARQREERPAVFTALNGYLSTALSACFPGSRQTIPTRVQQIRSYREASYYPPLPLGKEYPKDKATLLLRNTENQVEGIDISHSKTTPFSAVFGSPGRGKSAFLSMLQRCHDQKRELFGVNNFSVVVEVGGSFIWRLEDRDDAVSFRFQKDSEENWSPLPFHPLEALCFEGGNSDSDLESCRNFLARVLGIDLAEKNDSGDLEILTCSIKSLFGSELTYRISNFISFFYVNFKKRIDEIKDIGLKAKTEERMQNYLAYLKRFSKDGDFGKCFDPEGATQKLEHSKVRFWHFDIGSARKDSKDAITTFLAFAYTLGFSLADRFNPRSESTKKDKRHMLLIIDEANWQEKVLQEFSFGDLPDQCRKYDVIPILAFQNIAYLESLDKKLSAAIGKFFFYQFPSENEAISEQLKSMLGTEKNIDKMRKIGSIIDDDFTYNDIFSIGYVDELKRIRRLFVDIESQFLWEITTRAGGSDLREIVSDEFEISPKKASILLSKHGPKEIPISKVADSEIKNILSNLKTHIDEVNSND